MEIELQRVALNEVPKYKNEISQCDAVPGTQHLSLWRQESQTEVGK